MKKYFFKVSRRLSVLPLRLIFKLKVLFGIYSPESLKLFLINKNLFNLNKNVWIIGNGPSVSIKDLDKISLTKDIIVVANRFHLSYSKTKLRPTLVVSSDEQMIKDFGDEISRENTNAYVAFATDFLGDLPNVNYFFRKYSKMSLSKKNNFSVINGGGSLFMGIQLLFELGFRNYYLYGIDHEFNFKILNDKAQGDGNHFIKNYRSGKKWIPPRVKQIEKSFSIIKEELYQNNGTILNLSRKTKLNVIERRGLNEIL